MAKLNVPRKVEPIRTHEGAPAKRITPEQMLKRSVYSCMLWEDTFYEDGLSIAERIAGCTLNVKPEIAMQVAITAREQMKLRHVPLFVARCMVVNPRHKPFVKDTLFRVIQRPDEMAEFLKMYWIGGKCPIAHQVKEGLRKAFNKFDAYQLKKWDKPGEISIRDVMFLVHPKPKGGVKGYTKEARQAGVPCPEDPESQMYKKIADRTLESADTHEKNLSAAKKEGKSKKEVWERMLKENKIGALALLRNLRNFKESNVDEALVLNTLKNMRVERVLPFRFITAAKYAPQWEQYLEEAMLKCLSTHDKLLGHTVILVDVSGSMREIINAQKVKITNPFTGEVSVSHPSELTRMDAANALAILLREICEKVSVCSFSDKTVVVPARKGFALRDAIKNSQRHGMTYLGDAVDAINKTAYDRLVVITDEQSHDRVADPKGRGYVINVAPYEHGIGYGKWTHIDGFSEATIDWLLEYEKEFV